MSYNADRPIKEEGEDRLGRAAFARHLANGITEYKGKDGLVIGLYGKWGSGKTSIINMTINILKLKGNPKSNDSTQETSSDDKIYENKPIIFKFSPWNYSDKSDLIGLFFRGLKHEIEDSGKDSFKNTVGKLLTDYIEVLDTVSMLPIIGSGTAAILKILAQTQKLKNIREADLDKTKEKLETVLGDSKQKIVVVIDDIDRLTNSQIRDIFQLVKQVGNFPYVTYILAMDRDMVRKALEEGSNFDGEEYLDKIVQIPFEIPRLRKDEVDKLFLEELDKIICDFQYDVKLDMVYWEKVFKNCISPFIRTIRDVHRVINVFRFRYGMLYEETAFEDMIAITTLEVLESELYKWIFANRIKMLGKDTSRNDEYKISRNQKLADYYESIGIDAKVADCCLKTLFPRMGMSANISLGPLDNINKRRVANEGKFDLYFVLDPDDVRVSSIEIQNLLYKYDGCELRKCIQEVNLKGNIIYLMKELNSLIDKIPKDRIQLIAYEILDSLSDFKGGKSRTVFPTSEFDLAENVAFKILDYSHNYEEDYKLIVYRIERLSIKNIGVTAHLINRIKEYYKSIAIVRAERAKFNQSATESAKRYSPTESAWRQEKIIITPSDYTEEDAEKIKTIEEAEIKYAKEVESILLNVSISDLGNINRFAFALELWNRCDKIGVSTFLNRVIPDVNTPPVDHIILTLKFVCATAIKWYDVSGEGWEFILEDYAEFDILEKVSEFINYVSDKAKNGEIISRFEDEEKIKLATYKLGSKGNKGHGVDEIRARELVDEWMKVTSKPRASDITFR